MMSFGYTPMTYLDGDFEFGEARDDGYTELRTKWGESAMVPTGKLGELMVTLAKHIGLEEAESMIKAAWS
jgi:hypothetical protein